MTEVYVVLFSEGQYSERAERVVGVFTDKEEAKKVVEAHDVNALWLQGKAAEAIYDLWRKEYREIVRKYNIEGKEKNEWEEKNTFYSAFQSSKQKEPEIYNWNKAWMVAVEVNKLNKDGWKYWRLDKG